MYLLNSLNKTLKKMENGKWKKNNGKVRENYQSENVGTMFNYFRHSNSETASRHNFS